MGLKSFEAANIWKVKEWKVKEGRWEKVKNWQNN